MQNANHVFVVRPANFGFNAETAASNAFQNQPSGNAPIAGRAISEFDAFSESLKSAGINVTVFDDSAEPGKPDAIFPNNWISMHHDGTLVLYPMCAPSRRPERRAEIVQRLTDLYEVARVVDLSRYEQENKFLEGTGSMVFDHAGKAAYACLSPRTDKALFEHVCDTLGYRAMPFIALDQNGGAIYHTNVLMCVGERFVVICLEAVANPAEREALLAAFEESGKEVVAISFEQMNRFAGNMLELRASAGARVVAMSTSAYASLTDNQRAAIGRHASLLPLSIPTIETVGGGSARCMIAEIFSKRRPINKNV